MKNIHTLSIRIDKNVIDNLKILSEKQGRSLNKQIEFILKEYIEKHTK